MKKILILFLIIFPLNSFATDYYIGEKINKVFKLNKYLSIDLSPGEWEVIRKTSFNWRTLNQRIIGIGRVENNNVVEIIEIYEGLLSGKYVGAIDNIINQIVFYDKYDGCYERPEYYLVKVYRKGSTHNCLIVNHVEVFKLLNSPDDPSLRGIAAPYNFWIDSKGYDIPKIMLESDHSYFSRLMRGNWFRIARFIDPSILNAPKSKYFSEETSEYHPAKIENHLLHKKTMDEWVKLSFDFHKKFEDKNQIKSHHKLKLN